MLFPSFKPMVIFAGGLNDELTLALVKMVGSQKDGFILG